METIMQFCLAILLACAAILSSVFTAMVVRVAIGYVIFNIKEFIHDRKQ
jgi:hypothetical protein